MCVCVCFLTCFWLLVVVFLCHFQKQTCAFTPTLYLIVPWLPWMLVPSVGTCPIGYQQSRPQQRTWVDASHDRIGRMARLPVIGHGGFATGYTALLSVWVCNCCTLLYIPSQFGAKTSSSRSSLVCPCVPKPSERKEMAVDLLILDLLIDWSSKKGPNFQTGENSCMFRTSHRNFQDQWRWRVRISGNFKLYWAFKYLLHIADEILL